MTFTAENSELTISYLEVVLEETKYGIGHLSLHILVFLKHIYMYYNIYDIVERGYLFDRFSLWLLSYIKLSNVPPHWQNKKGVEEKC